jgi:hypothetical protein
MRCAPPASATDFPAMDGCWVRISPEPAAFYVMLITLKIVPRQIGNF